MRSTASTRATFVALAALLAAGCTTFEVDPDRMPASHGDHGPEAVEHSDDGHPSDGHHAEGQHAEGQHADDHHRDDHHASGGHAHDHDQDSPAIDGAAQVEVTADALTFDPPQLRLEAGEPVNVALTSEDILHDLVLDEVSFHLAAAAGETRVGGLVIDEPGTFIAYCSVPGHREAGMELEVVVR